MTVRPGSSVTTLMAQGMVFVPSSRDVYKRQVQHGFGDAVGFHLVLGALSPAQQGHRRQLLGRGPGLLLQRPT